MPSSTCRNDVNWSLPPKGCHVMEKPLNALLGQFYSLHTYRMMQKATEPQAQFKGLDFN